MESIPSGVGQQGYEWSNPNANASVLCHKKSCQSEEGDTRGHSSDRDGLFSPTGSLQEWGRDREHIKGVPRVTIVVGGVVLKLQLLCVRSVWEVKSLSTGKWKRQLVGEHVATVATVTDVGSVQNTEVFLSCKWAHSRDKASGLAHWTPCSFDSAVICSDSSERWTWEQDKNIICVYMCYMCLICSIFKNNVIIIVWMKGLFVLRRCQGCPRVPHKYWS